MAYKRMACQLKMGEHIVLPNSTGEDHGLITDVKPDKYGQYYDITFDNLTTEESNITFRYDGEAEVLTEEEFKREWPFELVPPSEEDRESFRKLLSQFGLEIEEEKSGMLFSSRHFQVKAKKILKCETEEKAKEGLIKFIEPFREALTAWGEYNHIPVTFNFCISEKGEIFAGLDMLEKATIKLPERVKNISLGDKLNKASEKVNAQNNKPLEKTVQER